MKNTMCVVVSVLLCTCVFSVLTWAEEFGLGDTGKPEDYDRTIVKLEPLETAKASFLKKFSWADLGMVTPAKNQGGCGSCWAFACLGTMESRLLGKGLGKKDLSEQQQISCNTGMSGCCGGSMAALKFWENKGPIEVKCAPYKDGATSCPKQSSVNCSSINCKELPYNTEKYHTVDTKDIEQVKASILTEGPTYFRYDVYDDFMTFWKSESQDTVYRNKSDTMLGGHAVLIIGWDDDKKAWLCKNSWGASDKRKDGFFWIAYADHKHDLKFGMGTVSLRVK